MNPVEIFRGEGPVLLAVPHSSTWLPDDFAGRLNENGLARADTDWHVDRLYDGLPGRATTVKACFNRYLIDANRDPAGTSLYPGRNTTGLCPVTDFDGREIYRNGMAPDAVEVASRVAAYHRPYHQALADEVGRLQERHGAVILYDCHSIRSHVPYLFEGTLPDLNVGSNDGTSCAGQVERIVAEVCAAATGYTHVVNGRFKGGWTTRQYGNPGGKVHAVQMELAQSTYLEREASPFAYHEGKASRLRKVLKEILERLTELVESGQLAEGDTR